MHTQDSPEFIPVGPEFLPADPRLLLEMKASIKKVIIPNFKTH